VENEKGEIENLRNTTYPDFRRKPFREFDRLNPQTHMAERDRVHQ
jgi:hypothetical protein